MLDSMSKNGHPVVTHSVRDASGTPAKKILKALRTSSRAGSRRANCESSLIDALMFTVKVMSAGRRRPEQYRRPGLFDGENEAVIKVFAQCADGRATLGCAVSLAHYVRSSLTSGLSPSFWEIR